MSNAGIRSIFRRTVAGRSKPSNSAFSNLAMLIASGTGTLSRQARLVGAGTTTVDVEVDVTSTVLIEV
jgi:hypothetical protein